MKKKKKQEIATTISSRERRDTAYVLDVEGLKDRFNVENPHALITVNVLVQTAVVDFCREHGMVAGN